MKKAPRSFLLKAMPVRISSAKRKLSQAKRFILVCGLAAFFIIPIFIIVTRILPKDGAGRLFYWLHDALYLPIKGYTYTWFYPFSLSWWGPIAIIILVWTIAYLAMVSPTKDLHGQLLRLFLSRPTWHAILLSTTARLRKWKLNGLLMREIANQERRKALLQLQILPFSTVPPDSVKRLYQLTCFHIRLLLQPPVTKTEYLEAAHVWHEAYLQFHNRLSRYPESEILKECSTQLAQLAETVLAPLVDWRNEAQFKTCMTTPPGFELPSILVDLFYLAALHNPTLTPIIQSSPQNITTIVATRLAESTTTRQHQIDKTRIQVERMLNGEIDALYFAKNENPESWPLLFGDLPFHSLAATLSLAIAFDLAGMLPSASLALGYSESLEALDFQLSRLPPEVWDAGMVHVLADHPASPDYGWCAHLAQEELTRYEHAWQNMPPDPESPVTAADFHLARSRVTALYHAAGPDFQSEEQ